MDERSSAMSVGLEIGTVNHQAESVLKENVPPQVLLDTQEFKQMKSHEGKLTRQEKSDPPCTPLHQMQDQDVDKPKSALATYCQKGVSADQQQQKGNEMPTCDDAKTHNRGEGERTVEASMFAKKARLEGSSAEQTPEDATEVASEIKMSRDENSPQSCAPIQQVQGHDVDELKNVFPLHHPKDESELDLQQRENEGPARYEDNAHKPKDTDVNLIEEKRRENDYSASDGDDISKGRVDRTDAEENVLARKANPERHISEQVRQDASGDVFPEKNYDMADRLPLLIHTSDSCPHTPPLPHRATRNVYVPTPQPRSRNHHQNGPPQVFLDAQGLNQVESLIHFSPEENKFGRVERTASFYRPSEESAILPSTSLFKSASQSEDELGCVPAKYRHEGAIPLERQRRENERPACDGDYTRRRGEGRRNLGVSKRVVLTPPQIREISARSNSFSFSERKQDGVLPSVFKTPALPMRRGRTRSGKNQQEASGGTFHEEIYEGTPFLWHGAPATTPHYHSRPQQSSSPHMHPALQQTNSSSREGAHRTYNSTRHHFFQSVDLAAPRSLPMPARSKSVFYPERKNGGVYASPLMTPASRRPMESIKMLDPSPIERAIANPKTEDLESPGSGTAAKSQCTKGQALRVKIDILLKENIKGFARAGKYFALFGKIRYVNEYKMCRDLLNCHLFYPYEADTRWSKRKERSRRFLKENAIYLRHIENDTMAFSRAVENLFQSVTCEPTQEEVTRIRWRILFHCCCQ